MPSRHVPAWDKRSAAAYLGFAVSSASTKSHLALRLNQSYITRHRLLQGQQNVPGPTIFVSAGTLSVPDALAAIAWSAANFIYFVNTGFVCSNKS